MQIETHSGMTIGMPPFAQHFATVRTSQDKRFIPISCIKSRSSILLNEGFKRWSVVYYLAIIAQEIKHTQDDLDDEMDMMAFVAFPVSLASMETEIEPHANRPAESLSQVSCLARGVPWLARGHV